MSAIRPLSGAKRTSPSDRLPIADLWAHGLESDQLILSAQADPEAALRLLLTSFGAGDPHFVRVTRLDSLIVNQTTLSCGSGCEAHFARQGKARLDDLRTAEVGTSDEPRSWSGRAVRFAPFTLCLSAQGPRYTDPTIAPAFDGLKISVSRRVSFYRPLPAWVVIPWTP
jgi:hypothetical protein